jgi:outer membrane lipoprotein SlyB
MPNRFALVVALALGVAPLAACTSQYGGNTVQGSGANQVNRVLPGVVLASQPVTIRGESGRGIGSAVGGVAGGIAGSTLGTSRVEGALGAIGGAVLGGLAGSVAGDRLGNESGVEYIIRLEDGQTVTVVQGAEPALEAGQRVLIVYGRQVRVIPNAT